MSPSWRGAPAASSRARPRSSKKDAVKEAAVASAAEHGISKRTVERSIAKAEGREPKPKAKPSEDEERDRKAVYCALSEGM